MSPATGARRGPPSPVHPRLAPLVGALADVLAEAPEGAGRGRVLAALSGGADSVALLLGLRELVRRGDMDRLEAVHVNHGLAPEAPQWQALCERLCEALGVALTVRRVDAHPWAGEGPEAAARAARYRALGECLRAGDVVCTAHHGNDQAETLLLALLRGAGPRGLAGMPRWRRLGEGWLCRPLLPFTRASLAAAVAEAGIEAVEDPSNRDLGLARGLLRRRVLPLLDRYWPGASVTLARAAAHQAESADLLRALARLDCGYGDGAAPDRLPVARLAGLDGTRARNALRTWIEDRGLPPPRATVLRALLRECVNAGAGASPLVRWPGASVRRHGGALHAAREDAPAPGVEDGRPARAWPGLARAEALDLGDGVLEVQRADPAPRHAALDPERLLSASIEVRYRQGGERCRPAGRARSQTLKKLLQDRGTPPWERGRLPLVYVDGRLAAVPGLWVCDGYEAQEGAAGLTIEFVPAG